VLQIAGVAKEISIFMRPKLTELSAAVQKPDWDSARPGQIDRLVD